MLFFYATGTTTPQNTYSDPAFTTPNSNPIVLDAAGRAGNIFMLPSPSYRVVLQDVNAAVVWDLDPVGPGAGGGAAVATAGVPVGSIMAYAGPTAPSGWLFCDGSLVSRTTYSILFGVISTAYGIGDGATTFGLPDLRGRAIFGKDDMGGTAANRITAGVSGITGTTLGASGGNQAMQQHNHTLADTGHTHTITDPGHNHTLSPPMFAFFGTGGYAATNAALWSDGYINIAVATTGITVNSATTGITIGNYGAGSSQNMPPAQICNYIIYHG